MINHWSYRLQKKSEKYYRLRIKMFILFFKIQVIGVQYVILTFRGLYIVY